MLPACALILVRHSMMRCVDAFLNYLLLHPLVPSLSCPVSSYISFVLLSPPPLLPLVLLPRSASLVPLLPPYLFFRYLTNQYNDVMCGTDLVR